MIAEQQSMDLLCINDKWIRIRQVNSFGCLLSACHIDPMTTMSPIMQGLLICAATWLLWQFLRRRLFRSPLDNIPGPASQSILLGNIGQFFNRHGSDFQKDVAVNYGSVVKLHGPFGTRMLYIADPKALHNIVIKEEHIYEEQDMFIKNNNLLFGPGLLSTLGEHHRKQRKMLNPVFSINHMRHLLPVFYNILHKLRGAIAARVQDGPKEIDMASWMGRTSLELIGQGGMGYSFDPLVTDVKDAYAEALKSLFAQLEQVRLVLPSVPLVCKLGPAWFRRMLLDMIPWPQLQRLKDIVDTMSDKSTEIFLSKKRALQRGDESVLRQVGEGKDIMSILMKANVEASDDDKMPDHELIAEMTTLILGAMDTTSNTLSRSLHLLAQHPDIQEKVRKEVLTENAGELLPYDELIQLPWLDAIVRETLRLHPPITMLTREPRKDMILPLHQPIRGLDGQLISEIPIAKGTPIVIGTLGINNSKALWGNDALDWKPERWLSPLPSSVMDAHIPGTYSNLMTFSGGKRGCIGFKFADMELKVVLAVLLSTFTFELTDKPIVWNVAGVWYPTVGKESNEPSMPLKVRLCKAVSK
ncbi:hypothetical protein AcW1_010348 [Taiwanofungus camphoratus]|nr:hypothetical protein AcW2_007731 [Antrodia cinnamomea]KAI0952815.1 hypothetical protein AcW1_010348 [Antrodia cinnamomea]